MLELRVHGRGGQGVVVGSAILGEAYFHENKSVQFFPEFGVERRGSPVQAFLRVSEEKIRCHYGISEPDNIILFDESLLASVDIAKGIKNNGWILINSKKSPDCFYFDANCRVATIDADGISLANGLGTESAPIINAAMTGAYAGLLGDLTVDSIASAIYSSVPSKQDRNEAAAREAFHKVKISTQNQKQVV